jgi:hypothetical protein
MIFQIDKKSFWGDATNRASFASMFVYGRRRAIFFSYAAAPDESALETKKPQEKTLTKEYHVHAESVGR